MKTTLAYLMELLNRTVAPWTENLRQVLLLAEQESASVKSQNCTVYFSLNQAIRRLETSRLQEKQTLGIESLIEELRRIDEDVILEYYIISTTKQLGTCYVLDDVLIGCEFVLKSGMRSRPGFWIDGKPIT